jgi:hypothetical protein
VEPELLELSEVPAMFAAEQPASNAAASELARIRRERGRWIGIERIRGLRGRRARQNMFGIG